MRKARKPITAMIARTRISIELNQSLSLPSSTMICSDETQMISSTSPTVSMRIRTFPDSKRLSIIHPAYPQMSETGTLMKKM
ncbi:hypothetical protein LMG28614_07286 [Paraburkholderia ultramafica]|uniref:Uncharacterized protein n=1 Tax=Paraburkholderia ultramafica TaxID=1544867 RepID=A0A6S7DJ80_9BURK|nr:hypothetical protein LMG28614_07286 [Paraburkholderia ultramafica]